MTKKQQKQWLFDQIDLAIIDIPGDYTVEGNHHVFRVPETTCVYKICTGYKDKMDVDYRFKRLTWFKTRLNKNLPLTIGCPKRGALSKSTAINNFIKDKEFANAINMLDLTDLQYGIGKGINDKHILYFPVEVATMWNRSIFITEDGFIIDKLSGLRIGEKGIQLTNEQEIKLANAPDNYNEIKQKLLEDSQP